MAVQVERLIATLEARLDKYEKGLKQASRFTDREFTRIERRGKMMEARMAKIRGLGKQFALGIAGGVTAALAPIALFSKAIRDLGEAADMKRVADRIGLSTDSLQAMHFAAKQIGVEIDQMDDGLGDFAAKVAEAAAGAGPLAQIFKANGVELKNQDGTLRSTREVLGDFADLIKNAQTPAQQLFLAQQAFGDEAAKMVPLFRNGARGVYQLESNAKSAGVVIDTELITRAEELDKRMQSMWETFSARSKSALLTAIQGMDRLLDRYNRWEQNRNAAAAGAAFGALAGKPREGAATTAKGDKPTALDARMAGDPAAVDQKLVDALRKRFLNEKPTVIPSNGSGTGGGGDKELRESVDYAQRLIENLEREKSLIGASALEIEKSNALWHAGTEVTAEQKQQIEALVTSIYAATAAHEAQERALDDIRDAARDFTGTLVDGLLTGKDASDVLSSALERLASQLINSGLDALFNGGLGSFGKGGCIGGSLFSLNLRRAS